MTKIKKYVSYEDFGAVGDGVTNDFTAIREAHEYANKQGLKVVSDPQKTYYIGNDTATALVMTDTDWSTSRFIIDDRDVTLQNRKFHVFNICSCQAPINLNAPNLKKGQLKLKTDTEQLTGNALVVAVNENKRQFMRVGLNQQSDGHPQTDCFVLDKSGTILTPVIWDFDCITDLIAYPIDNRVLTVTGGIFTTIANQAPSRYTYYARGILITRSNVIVDGLVHYVTGELDHGSPYHGFVRTEDCAYIIFKNCYFTGHKIYETIGEAGKPVSMGTYDISLFRSIGVSFINCKQDNILDMSLWGVFISNYCKDLLIDCCVFSRVDAHMDITNYTVRNSVMGWMGVKAIGHGKLLIENVTIFSNEILDLRGDYGSSWDGDLTIKNVTWYPLWYPGWRVRKPAIITCKHSGGHDFGYVCGQPQRVIIENLHVYDNDISNEEEYSGVCIFTQSPDTNIELKNFNKPEVGDYPYISTSVLEMRNLTTQSGKGFSIWSDYPLRGYCQKKHIVKDGSVIAANFRAIIDGIDGFNIKAPEEAGVHYEDNHRLVPHIEVQNCEKLTVSKGRCPMTVIRRKIYD